MNRVVSSSTLAILDGPDKGPEILIKSRHQFDPLHPPAIACASDSPLKP
jgi:hypothetical protein